MEIYHESLKEMSPSFLYVELESVTKRGKEIEEWILAKVNSEGLMSL